MGLRWTEEEYEHYLRRGQPAPISEKAFMSAVVKIAHQYGWLCWHAYNARKSPPGYPDLTLCHPSGQRPLIFAELKVPGGALTLAQHAWLDALTLAQGKEVAVWTPEEWPKIEARLRP